MVEPRCVAAWDEPKRPSVGPRASPRSEPRGSAGRSVPHDAPPGGRSRRAWGDVGGRRPKSRSSLTVLLGTHEASVSRPASRSVVPSRDAIPGPPTARQGSAGRFAPRGSLLRPTHGEQSVYHVPKGRSSLRLCPPVPPR